MEGPFLSFCGGPKVRQRGAWTSAVIPMSLLLLETAGLFHGLLERFQREVYKQVRRLASEGAWNLPSHSPTP